MWDISVETRTMSISFFSTSSDLRKFVEDTRLVDTKFFEKQGFFDVSLVSSRILWKYLLPFAIKKAGIKREELVCMSVKQITEQRH